MHHLYRLRQRLLTGLLHPFLGARQTRLKLLMVLWLIPLLANAQGQNYPTKITRPIRLIVPYVPGGLTDTLSRIAGPYIAEEFGQSVIIDNRPGGSSTIGTQLMAKAIPDGQTIGMIDAAFLINPTLLNKVPYETPGDFTPIGLIAIAPLILVTHPSLPVKSVKQLIALAKKQPGTLNFASAGNGSAVHLAGEQLQSAAKLKLLHIPYKGTGQALSDAVGGQVHMLFLVQGTAKPFVASGKLRGLAVTAAHRTRSMPQISTFIEEGLPDVEAATINGLVGPVGLPVDFVQRVNRTMARSMNAHEQQEKLIDYGAEVATNTPDEFRLWILNQMQKWAKAVKDSGVHVDNN